MTDTQTLAKQMRVEALHMVHQANKYLTLDRLYLFRTSLRCFTQDERSIRSIPMGPNRDRFILSKGHACVAVYAALAGVGILSARELA